MEIPGDPEKGLLSMVFREDGRWKQRQQGQCKVTEGSRGPGLARGGVEAQEANWVTSGPVRPTSPPQWPSRTRGPNLGPQCMLAFTAQDTQDSDEPPS